MPLPTFTVIVTTYNRAKLLGRTLVSIFAQTFGDFELLVIDDASTDQTHEVVAAFADPRLQYIRQPHNCGVSVARNTAIARARGTFIAIVDDDDTIEPAFLAEVNAALLNAPANVGFLWTWKQRVVQTKTGIQRTKLITYDIHDAQPLPGDDFLGKPRAGSGGLVMRATAFRQVGGFYAEFRTQEDTELLLRLAQRYDYIVVPQPLYAIFHHRGERLTGRSLERTQTYEQITQLHHPSFIKYPSVLSARYYSIGRDYYRYGDRRTGVKYLRQAIEQQPFNLNYRLRLLLLECFSLLPKFVQQKIVRSRSRSSS